MRLTLVSVNCNDRHYSLGAYILAAMVKRHLPEVDVRVCNYSVQQTNRTILFDLLANPADVYGVSVHHGHGPKVLSLIRDLKRNRPDAKILLGGTDAIALDPANLAGLVDHCVNGEGEWALIHALRAFAAGRPPESVPNLIPPGQLAETAAGVRVQSQQQEHLDDFPSPYLDEVFQEYDRYPTVFLETYRGCVWNCSFCYEGRGRRRTAGYSDDRVYRELAYLLQTRRVPQIEFYDTIFNVEPARTKRLLEFLISHNQHDASFIGEFMLEWLDEETIDLIGRANFSMMEVGLQSVREKTLKLSGRKVDLDRFRQNAQLVLERTQVNLCIDAMYGLDSESLDDFTATVDYIGEICGANGRRPTPILFTTNVHPGTRLYAKRASDLTLLGERGGTVLASPTLAWNDTQRFYHLFYGYLFLRSTFPRTMNVLTGVLQRHTGLGLSMIYEALASLLMEFSGSRAVFEQVDWTEFRSNSFLRFYLESVDRNYVLSLLDRLGVRTSSAEAEVAELIARENGDERPQEQGDR